MIFGQFLAIIEKMVKVLVSCKHWPKEIKNTLATRGLELLCQCFVLAINRFWFYILLMYLEYHTVVVLC